MIRVVSNHVDHRDRSRTCAGRDRPVPDGRLRSDRGGAADAAGAERLAVALKAIAYSARLRVISYIAGAPEADVCVGDLVDMLELSQGTVSHHLKILVDAGFLTRSKHGTFSFYALVPGTLDDLSRVLLT